ncbi:DUF6973 domain-containing protein [Caloranaerobacter ferrireducens]|uniref:DUF6973 domain-containing protein n=1 Tax=Caloranaerobacter ferrireducens TaxID=1323370 RepID=UPI00084DEBD0|nr:hypothetical protein [Caloranaerobacter ferrireducens]
MRHLKTFFIVFVCVLTILTGVSTVFATSNIEKISPSHVYDEINYGKLLKLEDVEYFMGKLNDYIKQNPDATNEELNRFLKAEMRKKYLNKNIKVNEVIAYSNYPAPVDLNPEEQKLYNENPTKGLKAIWQGKKAFNEANERYSSGLHNGNGDAFRHAYWNALMVKHIDYVGLIDGQQRMK